MKIRALPLVIFILLFFSQCTRNESLSSSQEEDMIETILTVNVPQLDFTRTNYKYDSSKGSLFNLSKESVKVKFDVVFRSYSVDHIPARNETFKFNLNKDNSPYNISLKLCRGVSYYVVIWASFIDGENYLYDIELSGNDIQIRHDGLNAGELLDGFYGLTYLVGGSILPNEITLIRPLTKIRYILTGIDQESLYKAYSSNCSFDIDNTCTYWVVKKIIESNLEPFIVEKEMPTIEMKEKKTLNKKLDPVESDQSLNENEALLFTTYILLPDCVVPSAKCYNEYNELLYAFPAINLKGKTDSKGNTITSLANKLVTIKQSALINSTIELTIEDDFD